MSAKRLERRHKLLQGEALNRSPHGAHRPPIPRTKVDFRTDSARFPAPRFPAPRLIFESSSGVSNHRAPHFGRNARRLQQINRETVATDQPRGNSKCQKSTLVGGVRLGGFRLQQITGFPAPRLIFESSSSVSNTGRRISVGTPDGCNKSTARRLQQINRAETRNARNQPWWGELGGFEMPEINLGGGSWDLGGGI
jgi:hypothetical protein